MATRKYRLTRGTHTVVIKGRPVTYRAKTPGEDILALTDEDAKRPILKGRIEPVTAPAAAPVEQDEDEGVDSGNEWESALSSLSAPDAIKAIQQLTDPDDVGMALDAEKAGKARTTVIEAASTRLKELGGKGSK